MAAPSPWRPSARALLSLLAGLIVFGVGDALVIRGALGNAPWTVLAEGLSLHTPLTIGTATQVIGALVLVGWIPLRERPGLGTVLNIVVIGLAIDATLFVVPLVDAAAGRWALLLLGIALIGLGSGLYLLARLGPGPRDGLMTGLHRRTGRSVSAIRFGIEVSVLLAGWALGGTVGVGTVAFAVLIGPAVATALDMLGRRSPWAGAPRA